MNNANISQFAKVIAGNNRISDKDADIVLKKLSIGNLRTLLKSLKTEENKKTVIVLTREKLTENEKKQITSFFSDKRVFFEEDASVGAGMKIKSYDMIYDLSLGGVISRLAENLE